MQELHWNPVALFSLVPALVTLAQAGVIYGTRPYKKQNRYLSLFLACSGLWFALFFGLPLLLADRRAAWLVGVGSYPVLVLAFWAYVLFMTTLDAPIIKPLRTRPGRWIFTAVMGAFALGALAFPHALIPDLQSLRYTVGWSYEVGPLRLAFSAVLMCIWTLGVVVAVWAYFRARTPIERSRMKVYMVAFVFNDAVQLLEVFHSRVLGSPLLSAQGAEFEPMVVTPLAALVNVSLLAYGILRYQLFGIDLAVKFAFRQSAVAVVFLGIFFFARELIEGVVSEQVGLLAGLTTAAALALGQRPVQRAAGRVADGLMPNVQDTPEYRRARAIEIYRAALEGAIQDSVISETEEGILERLREELPVTSSDVEALEREVVAALR